ncbi:energy transducer TonB [Formosa undariae]|uniref:Energy transducer TonB n=1 Tax=Formosa undariae TaxID=1325436 RepID=A0ABV5F1N3_9FLAO
MKIFITCVIALYSICMCAQRLHEDGPFKLYYENGNLKAEGVYKNNSKVGRWNDYFSNGQLEKERFYHENRDWAGFIRTYSEDGILVREEQLNHEGNIEVKHYFEDGSVHRAYLKKPVNEGKSFLLTGLYQEYYANGVLKVESHFSENELIGTWKQYYPNKNIEWEVNYVDSYKQGLYKQFYENGHLKIEGINDLDLKNGDEKHFDSNGNLRQTLKYKKGSLKNASKDSDQVEIPEGVLERVPIYPGCEGALGNAGKKKCMSSKIARFVGRKFNNSFKSDTNLRGIQKIHVIFKIDKNGHAIDVSARSVHEAFETEAIRVINLLPQMIPGYQFGEPVEVPYSFPINFKI